MSRQRNRRVVPARPLTLGASPRGSAEQHKNKGKGTRTIHCVHRGLSSTPQTHQTKATPPLQEPPICFWRAATPKNTPSRHYQPREVRLKIESQILPHLELD